MTDMETKPQPEQPNNGVQLGVGTLIIIAIIVSMCSGSGEVKKVQADTAEIKRQLGEINGKLDALKTTGAPATGGEAAAPVEAAAAPSRNP